MKTIGKFIVALSLTALTWGCNAELKNNSEPTNDGDGVTIAGDKSVCNYPAGGVVPGEPDSIESSKLLGLWQKLDQREIGQVREREFLRFRSINNSRENLQIELSTVCELKSQLASEVVSTVSRAADQFGKLSILASTSGQPVNTVGNVAHTCRAQINQGTFMYSFKDKCLILSGQYYLKANTNLE